MSTEKTLKVIGLGYPRTGTMSLKHALELLGMGPCYHMIEVFRRPDDAQFWIEAWDQQVKFGSSKTIDWQRVFQGFQSTTDCPGSGFWERLIVDFPQAKFVLTEREPESWYSSFQTTVFEAMTHPEKSTSEHREVQQMAKMLILDGIFEGRFEEKAFAIEKLQTYSEQIKTAVPKNQLLVMNIADGWQPLCDFLDLPVPQQDFPRSNTRTEFRDRLAAGRMADLSPGHEA